MVSESLFLVAPRLTVLQQEEDPSVVGKPTEYLLNYLTAVTKQMSVATLRGATRTRREGLP